MAACRASSASTEQCSFTAGSPPRASVTILLVICKTLDEALQITNKMVTEALGGLPAVKLHCSVLAEEALHAAIANYKAKLEAGEITE